MSDFDPDAYLQGSNSSTQAFDPDAHLQTADAPVAASTPPSSILDKFKGFEEASAHTGSKMAAGLGGGINYLGTLALTHDPEAAESVRQDTEKALTYEPKTAVGQQLSQVAGNVQGSKYNPQNIPGEIGDYAADKAADAGAPPWLSTGIKIVPQALPMLLGLRNFGKAGEVSEAPVSDAQGPLNKAYSGQSMGAAGSAPNIANLSPELQGAVTDAIKKGPVNQDALARHVEADSLPEPVSLTKGQALQDPTQLSNEFNMKLSQKAVADRFNEQNGQLIKNIQAIRDSAGEDVFSKDPVEHGDTLIQAYKDKNAAAQADISQKYQALKDANGGQFPVDAPTLLGNAASALHQQLLFDHAPPAVMKTLNRLADNNNMSFENFESLRTNLARVQRTATDGNERAAAGVIRGAMEDLPLSPAAQNLKPLADTARAAAKQQFGALEADPAYKAAVNDTVPPDKFAQKFVVNGNRDDVATMKQNFADNPIAQQTMSVAAIDHLRDAARINANGEGNFAQSNYNKNLQNLMPKIQHLMGPEQAAQLETLGNVARYTQFQPRGSTFNNSGSGILVGQMAKGALEHAGNVAAKGFPLGTIARKMLGNRQEAAAAEDALKPGAGIEQ